MDIRTDEAWLSNALGGGVLWSKYIDRLENQGAQKIFILTDLDEDICITRTKQRIKARPQDIVIIAVKKIESWFLASSSAIAALKRQPGFIFQSPEGEAQPFETINNLMIHHLGRGAGKGNGGKIKLITRLLEYGLDINQAGSHPNCPSAKYFIDKLTIVGKGK